MLLRHSLVLAFVALALSCQAALADKRVALLVGNSNYAAAGRLANPPNDVALMQRAFDAAGFDSVETAFDLSREAMVRALRGFEERAADSDIAVVYYSGHGMELDGENYLVPVDASLKFDRDVADETVPLDRVMRAVDGARRLKLVILDACRNNPFLAGMIKASGRTRSMARGLARVEPSSSNTLVAFAAKGGTMALDGDGTNSPFATALARRLVVPGAEIEFALRQVRDDVLEATANRQEPFKYGSLGGAPIMLSKLASDHADGATETTDASQDTSALKSTSTNADDIAQCAIVGNNPNVVLIESYLQRHPNGYCADSLRTLLFDIKKKSDHAALAVPLSPDPPPPARGYKVSSYWYHNGSIVALSANGDERSFYYERPREAMARLGVRPGTLLFKGWKTGTRYQGTAYVFSHGCKDLAYAVSGESDPDGPRIVMAGRAPRVDSTCHAVGEREDRLEFTFKAGANQAISGD